MKKKLLYITPFFPYPPWHGGKIRQYNIIKRLSACYDIVLLSLIYEEAERQYVAHMEQYCSRVRTVLKEPVQTGIMRRIFDPAPEGFFYYRSPLFHALIKEELEKTRYDILQVEYIYMALNIPEHRIPLRCITVHEPHTVICTRKAEVETSAVKKVFYMLQHLKAHRFQKKALADFDLCFTCSGVDRSLLQQEVALDTVKIYAVPNGVDTEYYSFAGKRKHVGRLIFTGAMDTYANEDAARYFCERVFPRLKQHCEDITFSIIGNRPTKRVLDLQYDPDVMVSGFVPDIREELCRGDILVVPIRVGGGTRLKILEAMASGCPVVSTRVGCEGLEVEDGNDILIADTPTDFVRSIISLCNDSDLKERLAGSARNLVESKYNWDGIVEKLIQIYEDSH